MKIEIPILSALLLLGTDLMARVALQGFEPALVSIALDWTAGRISRARKMFRQRRDPVC